MIISGAGGAFFSAGMLHPKVRATLTKEQILATVRLANSVFDRIEALPRSPSPRSTASPAPAQPS